MGYNIENVPPDLDPSDPGVLACAFSGAASIKFDTQGRLRVEVMVDPAHDWTALLLKDLKYTALRWLVYTEDEIVDEMGPEVIVDKVREFDQKAKDIQWDRAQQRLFRGSEGEDDGDFR